MFRNAFSFVDEGCDATHALRDAWKTLLDRRASNCTHTLGDDTACATEDAAFDAAASVYGSCYAALGSP